MLRKRCHPARMKFGTSMVPRSDSVSKAHLLRTLQAFARDALVRPNWDAPAAIPVGCRSSSQLTRSSMESIVTGIPSDDIYLIFSRRLTLDTCSAAVTSETSQSAVRERSHVPGNPLGNAPPMRVNHATLMSQSALILWCLRHIRGVCGNIGIRNVPLEAAALYAKMRGNPSSTRRALHRNRRRAKAHYGVCIYLTQSNHGQSERELSTYEKRRTLLYHKRNRHQIIRIIPITKHTKK